MNSEDDGIYESKNQSATEMDNIVRKKIIQKYYSKRAKDYDKQKTRTWKSQEGFGTDVIKGITNALVGFKNKVVLEVGVGSGRIAVSLLERIAPHFIGIDLSKEMLSLAKTKMNTHKQKFDLILGDAEHLPLISEACDALLCISTMHYFDFSERSLTEFSKVLKEKGVFVYGDLVMHKKDDGCFLESLEKVLSKAHAKYYKASEIETLLNDCGFRVFKTKIISYRKSYQALMEDKGRYFNVKTGTLQSVIHKASDNERELYGLDEDELTLFYALITLFKEVE